MIQAQCPNPACNRLLRMEEKLIGKRVKCIYCQQPFRVEAVTPAPEVGASTDAIPQALPVDDVALGTSGQAAGNAFESGRPTPSGSTASVRVLTSVVAPANLAPAPESPTPEDSEPPSPEDSEPPGPVEPPRLPPRKVKEAEGGLRIGPALISLLSVVIIIGSVAAIASFLLKPKAPVQVQAEEQSERWAAITIESSGVRLVIVDIKYPADGQPQLYEVYVDNVRWKMFKTPLTDFPKEPPKESLDNLKQILKDYDKVLTEKEVPVEYRLVACNNGPLTPLEKTPEDKIIVAYDWLQETIRQAMNGKGDSTPLVLDYIDPGLEAELGVRGSIPPEKRDKSVCLDIGRSSTKYGYFDRTHFHGGKFGFGTAKSQSDINAIAKTERISFLAAAKQWRPTIAAETAGLTEKVPKLINSESCYLLGGTPWVVAVLTHPDKFIPAPLERDTNITITAKDIETALKLVKDNPDHEIKGAVLAKVQPGKPTKFLEEELNQIANNFPQETRIAGITLLQGFADSCRFNSGKTIQFVARSLYAWPVGYIMLQSKCEG